MQINLDKLKRELLIKINNDNFYYDIIYFEFSIIYYGEKSGKILYKILNMKDLSDAEKKHSIIIKEIIKDNLHPIDKMFYNFIMFFIKNKNKELIKDLLDCGEYYSQNRYYNLMSYILDFETHEKLNNIMKEEKEHLESINQKNLKFKNFLEYENLYVYNKYKEELNISYEEFKSKMYNSNFCKKIRGESF
jgi:hypothetical protein